MKYLATFLLAAVISVTALGQTVTTPPSGDNQKSVVTQYIGPLVHVTVTYNSPDVHAPDGTDRKGKIWGELVPYGMNNLGFGTAAESPWRAGANENTIIEFSHDVLVEGKKLAAGKYGFHIIAQEDGPWTLIFSKDSHGWGSYFYDPANDALRVDVMPEEVSYHEWLTYEFTDRQPDQTTLAMHWEEVSVPFTIKVPDIREVYYQNMEKELEGGSAAFFGWQGYHSAASYLLRNDYKLEKALEWSEMSVSMPFIGQANFTTLSTKAQILEKMGRQEEADETMALAMAHPSVTVLNIHSYGRQLIGQDRDKEALEVFKYNKEKHGDVWPVNVGLARGYSAVGDYKAAIKHAQKALERAPDKLNKDNLTAAIEKLNKGEDMN